MYECMHRQKYLQRAHIRPTLVLHKQKLYLSPTHSPTHNHTVLLRQVVRWCFELLMKLAPVPGRRGGSLLSETQAASHLGPKLLPLRGPALSH